MHEERRKYVIESDAPNAFLESIRYLTVDEASDATGGKPTPNLVVEWFEHPL